MLLGIIENTEKIEGESTLFDYITVNGKLKKKGQFLNILLKVYQVN